MKTGMDSAPLDVESPIGVYAARAAQALSVNVLEHSIRHASMTVGRLPRQ